MNEKSSETCKIRILEKDYVINCGASERDRLIKSADFLNSQIKETRSSASINGGEKIMVMTALNLVHDFILSTAEKETKQEVETEVKSNNDEATTKKLHKLNKKIENALYQYQQIELT